MRQGSYLVKTFEDDDRQDLEDDVNAYLTALPPITHEWDTEVTVDIQGFAKANGKDIESYLAVITVRQVLDV